MKEHDLLNQDLEFHLIFFWILLIVIEIGDFAIEWDLFMGRWMYGNDDYEKNYKIVYMPIFVNYFDQQIISNIFPYIDLMEFIIPIN